MGFWKALFGPQQADDDLLIGAEDPAAEQTAAAIAAVGADLAHAPVVRSSVGGDDVYVGIAAIHSADPTFDSHGFLNAVETVFMRVRAAYLAGTPATADEFLTPSFRSRWEQLAAAWKAAGEPTLLDTEVPVAIRFHTAEADTNYDQICTHITAPAPPATGLAELRQNWTFIRYHIRDLGVGHISQKTCPNCGGPFQVDPGGRCHYCGAVLQGGVFDWRISDIADVTRGA